MRSEHIERVAYLGIIDRMERINALVMQLSLSTALRLSDCLEITSDRLRSPRPTVREQKTGKSRRVYIPAKLYKVLRTLPPNAAGYIFPHRLDPARHRCRETVYADFCRARDALGIAVNVTPHTARKIFAVEDYRKYGSLSRIMKILNHDRVTTTLLYALADHMAAKTPPKKKK